MSLCSLNPLVYYLPFYRRGACSPPDERLLSCVFVASLTAYFWVNLRMQNVRLRIRYIDCRAFSYFTPVVNRLDLYGEFLNLTNRGLIDVWLALNGVNERVDCIIM